MSKDESDKLQNLEIVYPSLEVQSCITTLGLYLQMHHKAHPHVTDNCAHLRIQRRSLLTRNQKAFTWTFPEQEPKTGDRQRKFTTSIKLTNTGDSPAVHEQHEFDSNHREHNGNQPIQAF